MDKISGMRQRSRRGSGELRSSPSRERDRDCTVRRTEPTELVDPLVDALEAQRALATRRRCCSVPTKCSAPCSIPSSTAGLSAGTQAHCLSALDDLARRRAASERVERSHDRFLR
jgi:hypothetical protein